jgi:hypothetical protein
LLIKRSVGAYIEVRAACPFKFWKR